MRGEWKQASPAFVQRDGFSWSLTRFPFHTSSAKKLRLNQNPVITVTGKAFFDVGHSLKDQKLNRRSHLHGYVAYEIHPVMKIAVNGYEI